MVLLSALVLSSRLGQIQEGLFHDAELTLPHENVIIKLQREFSLLDLHYNVGGKRNDSNWE